MGSHTWEAFFTSTWRLAAVWGLVLHLVLVDSIPVKMKHWDPRLESSSPHPFRSRSFQLFDAAEKMQKAKQDVEDIASAKLMKDASVIPAPISITPDEAVEKLTKAKLQVEKLATTTELEKVHFFDLLLRCGLHFLYGSKIWCIPTVWIIGSSSAGCGKCSVDSKWCGRMLCFFCFPSHNH